MSYQNFQIHPAVFTSIDKRIHLSEWQQASESLQNLGVTWYGLMVTQTNCQKITGKVAVFLDHPTSKKSRKKKEIRNQLFVHVSVELVDSPLSWNESGWWWPVSARPAKKGGWNASVPHVHVTILEASEKVQSPKYHSLFYLAVLHNEKKHYERPMYHVVCSLSKSPSYHKKFLQKSPRINCRHLRVAYHWGTCYPPERSQPLRRKTPWHAASFAANVARL